MTPQTARISRTVINVEKYEVGCLLVFYLHEGNGLLYTRSPSHRAAEVRTTEIR